MSKKEIITVCVGQMHYGGTLNEGEVIELKLLEESDFENNIGVFNQDGIQCGCIINKRWDSDIVEGILNNNMIVDFFYEYTWIVVKVYKTKSFLKGMPKVAKGVSEDTIEALRLEVQNYKDSIHDMISALDDAMDSENLLLTNHLRHLIEESIKIHNQKSNELVQLSNELTAVNSTSRVFDYYSRQSAK